MALEKQTIGVTLVDGLDTKNDLRTLMPGKLTAVSNLSLSQQGTLARVDPRLRLASAQSIRSLHLRKSELLGTAGDQLYSFDANGRTMIDRGLMASVIVRSEPIFTVGASQSTGNRYRDCSALDVAYGWTSGSPHFRPLICYAWTESALAAGGGVTNGYVRVVDATTGATIMGPKLLGNVADTTVGTRVVATSNAFLLFWTETGNVLWSSVIQYTSPTTLGTATSLRTDAVSGQPLEVCALGPPTSATSVFVVYTSNDATYSVRAVKVVQAAGVPSVSAGPADIETAANVTSAEVSSLAIASTGVTQGVAILAAAAAARPGLITAMLDSSCVVSAAAAQKDATAAPNMATGDQATVGFVVNASDQFVALSDRREQQGQAAAVYNIRTTTVSTANAITAGPAIAFYGACRADGVNGPWLAGKPYLANSRVYVPLAVVGSNSSGGVPLQNTWFLADAAEHSYVARCLYGEAGPAATGHQWLPSCVLADGGSGPSLVLSATRQQIQSGFDPNLSVTAVAGMSSISIRPRRTTLPETGPDWAECAETTFFGDALGSAYAGPLPAPTLPSGAVGGAAAEPAFLVYPEIISVANSAIAVNPLSAVARRFTAVYEWYDAAGQRHQSAPADPVAFTPDGVNQTTVTVPTLQATLMRQRCSIILYMSESATGPLLRVSQPGSAGYIQVNDITTATLSVNIQSTMTLGETLYTEDGTLESVGPGPMSTLCVHQDRILADVTDDPFAFQFSQAPVDGYGLQWNEDLRGQVTPQKGKITAVASMDGRGILFRERGITVLNGLMPLSDGTGGSLQPEDLATDVGCMWPHSVCNFSNGILFKSAKGWHVLDRSLNVVSVGDGPALYDSTISGTRVIDAASNPVYSAFLSDTRKEIRVESAVATTSNPTAISLIYNYERNQWSTTSNAFTVGPKASLWWPVSFPFYDSNNTFKGSVTGAVASALFDFGIDLPLTFLQADSSYSPLTASFTTGWLKPSEAIQGYQRVWWVELAGSVADGSTTPGSTLTVTLEMVTPDGTTTQTYAFTTNNLIASGQTTWQARCKPTVQKVNAIRVTASDVPASTGGGVNFSGITLVVGVKRGAARAAAAKTL